MSSQSDCAINPGSYRRCVNIIPGMYQKTYFALVIIYKVTLSPIGRYKDKKKERDFGLALLNFQGHYAYFSIMSRRLFDISVLTELLDE